VLLAAPLLRKRELAQAGVRAQQPPRKRKKG